MGTFSPFHWIIFLAMAVPLLALFIVPTWRILQRAGFNGAWALLMLVPIVGILVLWFVSFLKWPSDREGRTQSSKGWLVLGVVLVPLAFIAPVLMFQGTTANHSSAAKGAPTNQEGAPKTLTYEEAYGLPAKR